MSALNESLATDPKHAHCFNLCVCGTIRMPNAAGAASPSSAATAAAGGDEFADAATANRVSQFARTAMRQKDHEVVIDVGKELATESEVLKSSQQTVQSIRRDIDAMKAQLQRAGLGMDKLMAIEGQFNTLVTTSLQQEQRLIDQKTATIQRLQDKLDQAKKNQNKIIAGVAAWKLLLAVAIGLAIWGVVSSVLAFV